MLASGADSAASAVLQVGPIREVSILRDQVTGVSRGCAFVIFDDKAVAEAAIAQIDRHFTLPGATQPIEVRCPGPFVRGNAQPHAGSLFQAVKSASQLFTPGQRLTSQR